MKLTCFRNGGDRFEALPMGENVIFISLGAVALSWTLASSITRFVFLDHTQRHTTVGRTHLDE